MAIFGDWFIGGETLSSEAMRLAIIFSLVIGLLLASRFEERPLTVKHKGWFDSWRDWIWDWWYGKTMSECRDLVPYHGHTDYETSAEEFTNSDDYGSNTTSSTTPSSSGSSGDRQAMLDLTRSIFDKFFSSETDTAGENKVWRNSLEDETMNQMQGDPQQTDTQCVG